MIFNSNLFIIFHSCICIHVNYVNGYDCFDGTTHSDCTCSTGTSGAIGTCICQSRLPANVRQGQPCAKDNGVDSVSYIFLL